MIQRQHTASCRLTDDQAEHVEQLCARLGISRAAWLQSLVDAALEANGDAKPGRHAKIPADCDHPKARVIKGFCYKCGKPVRNV